MNRQKVSHKSLRSKTAIYVKTQGKSASLTYIFIRVNKESSTNLRKKLGKTAFMRNNKK